MNNRYIKNKITMDSILFEYVIEYDLSTNNSNTIEHFISSKTIIYCRYLHYNVHYGIKINKLVNIKTKNGV